MLKSYEELVRVDVSQYCEKRDGFTYLNWAKCIELLRENGATIVYWEPVPDPRTGSSLRKTDIEFNGIKRGYWSPNKKQELYGVVEIGSKILAGRVDTEIC